MPKKPEENPLFRKNIPPPPATTPSVTTPLETASTTENGKTVSEENGKGGERQAMSQASAVTTIIDSSEERATIELSLYLRPSQDDKLEDLRRAYKRRTGKKISANEVMRRLIEKATLDTLL